MPSFRSLFFFAATAFTAFASTSAAPIAGGADVVGDLTQALGNNGNGIAANHNIQGVNVQGIPVAPRDVVGDLTQALGNNGNGLGANHNIQGVNVQGIPVAPRDGIIPTTPTKTIPNVTGNQRRDDLQTLPEILNSAQAQLATVAANLNVAASNGPVSVQVLVNIVAQVGNIVNGAVSSVKLLVGMSSDFILTLNGQVLSVTAVAQLVLSLVATVGAILSYTLKLVVAASQGTVLSAIANVGPIVVNLIQAIFTLVPGISAALQPTLGPVITVFTGLQLTIVVQALNGN
ncbi:hypothetical protein H0H92_005012 [Tricholoma furcatifolium]|nr:hypothetical protein H0H92_005012 [Tricholoma furcatifolium]